MIVQQGDINGYGYSLYLNNLSDQLGTLLFGGVDHDKYQGTLGVVPIINIFQEISQPIQFNVALSSISVQIHKESQVLFKVGMLLHYWIQVLR